VSLHGLGMTGTEISLQLNTNEQIVKSFFLPSECGCSVVQEDIIASCFTPLPLPLSYLVPCVGTCHQVNPFLHPLHNSSNNATKTLTNLVRLSFSCVFPNLNTFFLRNNPLSVLTTHVCVCVREIYPHFSIKTKNATCQLQVVSRVYVQSKKFENKL